MNAALVALGPPAIAVGLVRDLRASGVVQIQSLFGVLSLYMLIGMLFGFVYGAIDRFGGDPFFAGGHAATIAHCIYFSFTTLATVGYGDFVARSDLGHTLAVSEALIGQIYLVTVVSLIVSNLRRPPRDDVRT
jgi:Ion channel